MKKNKSLLYFIIFVFIIISTAYFIFRSTQLAKATKVIAVVTTLSHPALEMARQSFMQEINTTLGTEYKVKDFNAEGSMQSANIIARQIAHDDNIAAIFALGSLAAQALGKAEKNRPIVIAAVSDPEAIMPDKSTNICGLSDALDTDYQISAILDLLPQTKRISLLYSPHETNSASVVKKLETSMLKHHIKTELIGVYEPQQVASASLKACQTSDVLLIPLDNQLAASMPAVIKATKQESCVVILSDSALIHHGAALAFGVDYKKIGREAAVLMSNILLKNQSPEEINIINPQDIDIYVNKHVIKEKAIKLNPTAKTKITYTQEEF